MTLVSRSGTIGRMVYSRPEMVGMWATEHAVKIVPDPARVRPGYLYAFLNSRFGLPLLTGGTYQEAWLQLLLQAFLQRIVNSGGRIEREYGLGRGRTDLLLVWPHGGASGAAGAGADRGVQQAVIECKVAHGSLERTIAEGTEQTAGYLDRCAAQEGHLVVFDRGEEKSWAEKIFRREARPPHGRTITVWGM